MTSSKSDYMMTYRMYDRFSYCEKCGSEGNGWKPIELKFCPDCKEWLRHKPRINRASFLETVIRY
jgi:hypothetical protein